MFRSELGVARLCSATIDGLCHTVEVELFIKSQDLIKHRTFCPPVVMFGSRNPRGDERGRERDSQGERGRARGE